MNAQPYNFLEIQKLRLDGLSWNKIATYYNRHRTNVKRWFERERNRRHTTDIIQKEQGGYQQLIEHKSPIIIDTRNMSWEQWVSKYLGITLYDYQIEVLERMDILPRDMENLPRRHGKTLIIMKAFCLRKMCESQFHEKDQPIIYMSAIQDIVIDFVMDLANELIENETIIKSYGELIEDNREDYTKKRTRSRNTQLIITLKNRKSSLPSLKGVTISSRYRGSGARWVLIDDAIDTHAESELHKETKKLLRAIKQKITPVAMHGSIILLGTRYGVEDIFVELSKNSLWAWHSKPAIIKWGVYSIPGEIKDASEIFVENYDDWELLSFERWDTMPIFPNASAIQKILYYLYDMGDRDFSQEYQNDPKPLNPEIDFNWYQSFIELPQPPAVYNWAAFVDVAVSEKEGGDYTAVVLMANLRQDFYWYDHFYVKLPAAQKYKRIEQEVNGWQNELGVRIPTYIESVLNQREAYQFLRDESTLTVKEGNPRDRGNKYYRIMNGLAVDMQRGRIWLREGCRFRNQLKRECDGFPLSSEDHILDAGDQCHFYLKKSIKNRIYSPKIQHTYQSRNRS